MTDSKSPSTKYSAPSVERWGSMLDLTGGADKGGSGDPYGEGDHSIFLPDQADGGESGQGN